MAAPTLPKGPAAKLTGPLTPLIKLPAAKAPSTKPAKAAYQGAFRPVPISTKTISGAAATKQLEKGGALSTKPSATPWTDIKAIATKIPQLRNDLVKEGRSALDAIPALAVKGVSDLAGRAVDQPGNPSLQRSVAASTARDIPREVVGKGAAEKLLSQGGRIAAGAIAKAGASLPGAHAPLGSGMQAEGLPGQLLVHAGEDAVNLPAEALPSGYLTARALANLAAGHPAQAEAMAKSIGTSLTSAKGWEQHPLNNLLQVSGGLSALGRVGEAAMLRDVPPERAPEPLYAHVTSPLPPLSRDPGIRFRQRLADAWRSPIDTEKPRLEQKSILHAPAGRTSRLLARRATEETERNFVIQQRNRDKAIETRQAAANGKTTPASQLRQIGANVKDPHAPIKPQVVGKEAVNLIAQGVIRRPDTVLADLERYRQLILDHEVSGRKPSGRETLARDATLKNVETLMSDHQFLSNPGPAFAAAAKFRTDMAPLQDQLVKQGHITGGQMSHAKLVPYAMTHMGATYGELPQPQLGLEGVAGPAAAEHGLVLAPEVRYHGSGAEPATIFSEGLNRGGGNSGTGVYLTHEPRGAGTYLPDGGYLYSVDTRGLPVEGDHGEVVARSPIGPGRVKLEPYTSASIHGSTAAKLQGLSPELAAKIAQPRTPQLFSHDEVTQLHRALAPFADEAHPDNFTTHRAEAALRRNLGTWLREFKQAAKDGHTGPHASEALTDTAIRAHMRANGVPEPAFVSHRLSSRAQAMYGSLSRHALAETKERTGAAFSAGNIDTTHEALIRQHLASQLLIDRHNSVAHLLKTFAVHKPGGGYFKTWDEANLAGQDPDVREKLGIPEHVQMVPVRIAPQFVRENQLTAIKHSIEGQFDESNLSRDFQPITKAVEKPEDPTKPGQYMLIGRDVAERIKAHERPRSTAEKMASGLTSQFVHTVLPLSIKRMLGLTQEQLLRLLPAHTGPMSGAAIHTFLNKLDDEQYQKVQPAAKALQQELTVRAFPGLAAGQVGRSFRHNTAESYTGTVWQEPAKIMEAARGTPVLGHLARGFHGYSESILNWQRKLIETPAQQLHAGQFLLQEFQRDSGIHFAKALRFQGKAVEDFINQKLNTPNQTYHGEAVNDLALRMARYVDAHAGRYGRNSPLERQGLIFSPFGMWFGQSLKFIYATMPHEHPVITGLLAAANQGTAAQRAALGLSGPLSGNTNEVPDYEEGGIPVGNKILALQYYSPMGAVTQLPDTIAGMFPYASPIFGFGGGNWKFEQASTPSGKVGFGDRLELGTNALAQMIVPGLQQVQTVMDGGAKTYDTGNVFNPQIEPGQKTDPLAAFEGLFRPVREYSRSTGGGAGFGSGFSSGFGSGGFGTGSF